MHNSNYEIWLGNVVQACNLCNSGSKDWEDHSLRPTQEKLHDTPIATNGWVQRHTSVISNRRIAI
jgi:hypothetical protein